MDAISKLKNEFPNTQNGVPGMVERKERAFWIRGSKLSVLRRLTWHFFLSAVAGYLEGLTVAQTLTAICSYIDRAPVSYQALGLSGFAVLQSKKSYARVVG